MNNKRKKKERKPLMGCEYILVLVFTTLKKRLTGRPADLPKAQQGPGLQEILCPLLPSKEESGFCSKVCWQLPKHVWWKEFYIDFNAAGYICLPSGVN
jgi:hypothetical protein